MRRFLPLLLLLFVLPACDTAESGVVEPDVTGVYVGNQGNFTDETGSVAIYDPETGAATQNALGIRNALVQQIVIDPENPDRGYVLLNFNDSFSTGRGLVAVVDLAAGQRIADVAVNTPRHAVRVGTTLWVTSLYADTVTPVDLATFTAAEPVEVGAAPEGIAAAGERVYVANSGFGFSTTLSFFTPGEDPGVTTLDLGDAGCDGPRALGTDGEDEVWVFCTGKTVYDEDFNVIERTDGAVFVLDGSSSNVVTTIPLDDQIGAASLGQDAHVNAATGEAWAVRTDGVLLHFDTAANALVGTVTPELPDGYLVGAVASDADGRVYVGAVAPDFASAGQLVVLNGAGDAQAGVPAGIIPAAIALR